MNKRGAIVLEEIIFFVLNVAFFLIMLIFIVNGTVGKAVYEQAYAKQIAFIIDGSKPRMTILLDMEKAIQISGKKIGGGSVKELVTIDNDKKKVLVKLGNAGGKSFPYFSDVKVTSEFQGSFLKLEIEEKNV